MPTIDLSLVTIMHNWPLTAILVIVLGYIGIFLAQYSGSWTLRLVAPFAMIDFWFSNAALQHPTAYELDNLAFIQCTWWLGIIMTIIVAAFLLGPRRMTAIPKS